MKNILFLVLLLLVACAPAASGPQARPAPVVEPTVMANEVVTSPPQPVPQTEMIEEVTGTPMEPTGSTIDPYSQIGCEQLLTADEFTAACHKDAANFVVTHKIGTKNCYVNAKDRQDNRLTAGVSLSGFADSAAATKEFDRRLVVLKVGADKSVGERAYTFPKIDRQTINFVKGKYIVEVGSDTRLCSQEDLLNVARYVDSRLR